MPATTASSSLASSARRLPDARVFVHFDPESVAGSVAERRAEAAPGQLVARGGVDGKPRRSRPDRLDRQVVSRENGSVHLPNPRIGRADRYGPGEVHAV